MYTPILDVSQLYMLLIIIYIYIHFNICYGRSTSFWGPDAPDLAARPLPPWWAPYWPARRRTPWYLDGPKKMGAKTVVLTVGFIRWRYPKNAAGWLISWKNIQVKAGMRTSE